jgi:Protein of unknown function (DUF4231)
MDAQTYLKDRVEDQLNYFSAKSATSKKWYYRLQIISIACGIAIPILVGYVTQVDFLKYIVGGLGALVAFTESVQLVYKYKENWINYRGTAEALTRERFLFEANSGPYAAAPDAYKLFVEHIENILSSENRTWMVYSRTEKKE